MLVKEAIILAGGLGTRLRDTIPDLPKCMAPVAGRPFLFYVINYLRSQGIEKFIFSLGYKHEAIEDYLDDQFSTLNYQLSIEDEPLGTGGAIQLACFKTTEENVLVANGDTIFSVDLHDAFTFHLHNMAECTLLLKPMENFNRYGVVETDTDNLVKSFREKQFYAKGNINGGVYFLNKNKFLDEEFPAKFSFEQDYLEKFYQDRRIYGLVQDEYFIDIGIPEDYQRAQTEFARPVLDLKAVDKNWTLFIDRDGIINHEKKDDYIRNWNEFKFYDGIRNAFQKFADKFGKINVVSNQRGVGRGLMTEDGLIDINQNMQQEIEAAGGRIDAVYYCTSTDNKHPDRKPNPGMAFRAKADDPVIDLSRSIMIGNKLSDMRFGRNAGAYTVFIASTNPETAFPHPDIDLRFETITAFAKAL
ncbi:MAG: HAD-IIIA family hydrolase [Chitinophagaceae bacterium]|nr:HAD-IIIA family hydrolase [Chitinophagaceae bacterium]